MLEHLVNSAIDVAVAAAVAAVVPLVAYGIAYVRNLAAKAKIQLSAAAEERLKQAALDGIALAAERARQYAKDRAGAVLPSSDRLRIATTEVLAKLPNVSKSEAENAVHAVLPHVRTTIDTGTAVLGNAIRTQEPRPS